MIVADIHILQVLQEGWNYIVDHPEEFVRTFEQLQIEPAIALEWSDALLVNGKRLEIELGSINGQTVPPAVMVELGGESMVDGVLGQFGGNGDGAVLGESKVKITIFASKKELVQAIYATMVRILIHVGAKWLQETAGYSSFGFGAAQDLRPAPEMAPEQLGMFKRELVVVLQRGTSFPALLAVPGNPAYLRVRHYDAGGKVRTEG
jgi:hypothetical protein